MDVTRTIARMLKLPAIIAAARQDGRSWLLSVDVNYELRHRGGCSGRAWSASLIWLSIGPGCPRHQVEELILHELVHYVLPDDVHHGQRYRTVLIAALREWFPGVRPRWEGNVYAMDEQVWRDAWQLAGGDPGAWEATAMDEA